MDWTCNPMSQMGPGKASTPTFKEAAHSNGPRLVRGKRFLFNTCKSRSGGKEIRILN